jgi:hypothetical protein
MINIDLKYSKIKYNGILYNIRVIYNVGLLLIAERSL